MPRSSLLVELRHTTFRRVGSELYLVAVKTRSSEENDCVKIPVHQPKLLAAQASIERQEFHRPPSHT